MKNLFIAITLALFSLNIYANITTLNGLPCTQAWNAIQKEYFVFLLNDDLKVMGILKDQKNFKNKTEYAILTMLDAPNNSCNIVLKFSDKFKFEKENKQFEESLLEKITNKSLVKNLKN